MVRRGLARGRAGCDRGGGGGGGRSRTSIVTSAPSLVAPRGRRTRSVARLRRLLRRITAVVVAAAELIPPAPILATGFAIAKTAGASVGLIPPPLRGPPRPGVSAVVALFSCRARCAWRAGGGARQVGLKPLAAGGTQALDPPRQRHQNHHDSVFTVTDTYSSYTSTESKTRRKKTITKRKEVQ